MPDKKDVREELAGLTEAVRELRDNEVAAELAGLRAEVEKLRAERNAHSCHGHCCGHVHCNWGHCGCLTIHYGYVSLPAPCSPYWTVTGGTSVIGSAGYTVTAVN